MHERTGAHIDVELIAIIRMAKQECAVPLEIGDAL